MGIQARGFPNHQHKDKYADTKAFKIGNGIGMIVSDITNQHRSEEQLIKSQGLLRSLSLHLQSLREKESRRMAREIHDEMAPALTALRMDLAWISAQMDGNLDPNHPVKKKMRSMVHLIDTTIDSVQKICSELRPVLLDDLGLIPALEWQVQEFQRRTKIKCAIKIDCDDISLNSERSVCLFRIFQEALTNIARHASATKAWINLEKDCMNSTLKLKIRDNGRGISEIEAVSPRSFGLVGMRERLHPFNGQLRIEGKPNKGTTIAITLPFLKPREIEKET